MRKIVVIMIALPIFLCGCAGISKFNSATGKNEIVFISSASEVETGKGVHEDFLKKEKLSADKQKTDRINRIGQALAKVSDRQDYEYKFYLIEKDDINAFTSAGGYIYMYTGLYDKLKTDDEIAAVLAHEIGHCSAKHIAKKMQAQIGYNVLGALLFPLLDVKEKQKEQIALAAGVVMQITTLGYSRQDEYAADGLSVKYTVKAGYDPNAVIKVLEIIKENSKGPEGPQILRSHPYLNDRIEYVKLQITKQREGA